MNHGETFTAAACQGYWGALGMTRESSLSSLLPWSLLQGFARWENRIISAPHGDIPVPHRKSPWGCKPWRPRASQSGQHHGHGAGSGLSPTELPPTQEQPLHPLQLLPTAPPFRTTPKMTSPEITTDRLKLSSPRYQPAYPDKPHWAQPLSQISIPACLRSHTSPPDGQHPTCPRPAGSPKSLPGASAGCSHRTWERV